MPGKQSRMLGSPDLLWCSAPGNKVERHQARELDLREASDGWRRGLVGSIVLKDKARLITNRLAIYC
jgi:hypothetical protein